MLKLDWYIELPIDFEYKNYILLSYLKEIHQVRLVIVVVG